mgnify:CR=1 FL=1
MLNKEKYAKEILEIAISGNALAKANGKLCACNEISCGKCDFSAHKICGKDCGISLQEWANSEYIEVDWNKVEDGAPIWVKREEDEEYFEREFAFVRNGKVVCYALGDKDAELPMYTTWEYARLDNPNEEKQ